ncbi:MAG: type II toxin-antitoxin system VapC family toxin [Pirellulaceae bacterium]|nr:type II toxin-antitoxin system VapC family toxin [Pirellulaceae bacterium]
MSVVVVDSSVGLKWFVPEAYSAEARSFRSGAFGLHTLARFFDLEIANILWKKMRRAELTSPECNLILTELPALPVARHDELPLLSVAFDLAVHTQRTVYDCLYLALAVKIRGQMLTADERLCNSIATTPWKNNIRWLGNLAPAP